MIKRYAYNLTNLTPRLQEHKDGAWVRHRDYLELQGKLEAAEANAELNRAMEVTERERAEVAEAGLALEKKGTAAGIKLLKRLEAAEEKLFGALGCCKLTRYPPYHIIGVDMFALEKYLLEQKT